MSPSETIIALRKLWAKMTDEQKESFETEDAFIFFHLDEIYKKSNA